MTIATAIAPAKAPDYSELESAWTTQRRRLLASAYSILRCPAKAEDAVSEAVVRVMGFQSRGETVRNAGAVLNRAVTLVALEMLRTAKGHGEVGLVWEDESIAAEANYAKDLENQQLVNRWLKVLSEPDRELLLVWADYRQEKGSTRWSNRDKIRVCRALGKIRERATKGTK